MEYPVNPIIYCEISFYNRYLKDDFAHFDYWICDLGGEPVRDYVIWQYTDRGLVQGIGRIDNNRFHKNKCLGDYLL